MRPMPKRILCRAVLVLALIFTAGCDSIFGRACTAMGCGDTLSVLIEGAFDAGHTATLRYGDSSSVEGVCEAGACRLWLKEATPAEVTFEIRDADGAVVFRQELAPDYQPYRPNGPSCDPECLRAEIELVA